MLNVHTALFRCDSLFYRACVSFVLIFNVSLRVYVCMCVCVSVCLTICLQSHFIYGIDSIPAMALHHEDPIARVYDELRKIQSKHIARLASQAQYCRCFLSIDTNFTERTATHWLYFTLSKNHWQILYAHIFFSLVVCFFFSILFLLDAHERSERKWRNIEKRKREYMRMKTIIRRATVKRRKLRILNYLWDMRHSFYQAQIQTGCM